LLLSLLLRRRGLGVIYLGADSPLERLEETASAIQPNLIVLAAQQLSTAATIQSAALVLQRRGFALAYGGMIFNRVPELRERIPAYFLGETLEGAVQMIERLVLSPVVFSGAINVDEAYRQLARLFREKRALVEVALFEKLPMAGLAPNFMEDATSYLGDALSAALELGAPAFLEADMDWVRSLLSSRQIPAESLLPYLAAYGYAIRNEMGNAGAPITEWIDSYITRNEANP
jgi:hypothetical protein